MTPRAFDRISAQIRCQKYRKRILDISQKVTALHIAPAFSCTEITDVIYNTVMRAGHDVFLMSKGHGCMIQYVILEDLEILSTSDLELYCNPQGRLGAHPDFGTPGIAASTGSLGHGLGIAVGQAYAEKIKKSDVNFYCVISDGEFQEGSTWEAILMAGNLRLRNLIVVMDNNDFSGLERMSEGHPAFYPVSEKVSAFGWDTVDVDGHDSEALFTEISNSSRQRPLFITAKTIKGKGVSFMEGVPIWHYRSPNADEYQKALIEITRAIS